TQAIEAWIRIKKDRGTTGNYLLAIFSLLGGLVTLFLTFWIAYFVIYLAVDGLSALCDLFFNFRFHIPDSARLVFSGVFVLVLSLQYFWTAPSYWTEYPTDEKDFGPLIKASLGDYQVLSPVLSHPKTVSKAVADVLLTGPRLFFGTWGKI